MSQNRRKKGFVLVAMAVSAFAILGAAGLAIDLGRMFIVRNEAQTYTDFVALAAVQKLNGTTAGVTDAAATPSESALRYGFAQTSFTGTSIRFSRDAGATWVTTADAQATPINVTHVEVTQLVSNVSLYFMPVVTGMTTGKAGARSVAGQELITRFDPGTGVGTLPFTPITHELGGTNNDTCLGSSPCADGTPNTIWGYALGDELTLRWPSESDSDCDVSDQNYPENCDISSSNKFQNRYCDSDNSAQRAAYIANRTQAERGYFEYNSANDIRQAVLGNDSPDFSIYIGATLDTTTGVKATQADALMDRVNQDPNAGENAQYSYPNGWNDYLALASPEDRMDWRIGIVPITDYNRVVLGFAKVYLPKLQDKPGNRSLCAIFVGVADLDGSGSGGSSSSSGRTLARLVE